MDRAPSISFSGNHEKIGLPDETGMEQVQSDLKALKGLYGLLHKGQADENFDETSRAYLLRMLDDATETALLRQAKMISGSLMPPALERNLSIRSGRQARAAAGPRQSLNPPASPSLGLRQVSERLHRLDLHRSPSSSRDGRRHAAEEPVLSRLPSNRSSRTAMPPRHHTSREQPNSAAPRPPLNLHHSPSSRRDGRHARSHRHAAEEPVLSRFASIRSSRTAMPPRCHPSREQHNSGPGLNRLSVAATSQHGTLTGRSPRADLQHRTRPIYDRGDRSSLERGSTRRSVSRKLSLGRERPPADHATVRRTRAGVSSSTRNFGRLGTGLSVGMTSRAGRGVATPRYSSSASSNEAAATIRSRIRPHRELTECSLRPSEEQEEESCTPRRRSVDDTVSSAGWSRGRPRRTQSSMDSSRSYTVSSSGAASSFTYTSSTVPSPASSSSASSYYSPMPRPGSARAAYASEASDSSRSCRRRRDRKRKERREGRLRRFTKKIAMVFHHRHDHHHHHHYPRGQESPPPSRSDRRARNRKSPWTHLGGLFHRTKGQDKKTTSQTTVSVLAKKRGGGDGHKKRGGDRHMHVLFSAMRHLRGKRKAPPASVKMRKMASRVQVKKMHWWQQLRKARVQPRHRLGHGKAM